MEFEEYIEAVAKGILIVLALHLVVIVILICLVIYQVVFLVRHKKANTNALLATLLLLVLFLL